MIGPQIIADAIVDALAPVIFIVIGLACIGAVCVFLWDVFG